MFLMEYHMIYIVEVRTDEQIIGNYRLDKGSLDFHLNLERRIPFDYLDFNKYQCCFLNVSDEEYERRLAICKECEKLNEGTCLACGCYVELRAAAKAAHCSHRKW